jgi:hypothetical protein
MKKRREIDVTLTPEQIAEIERRLSNNAPVASDDEVGATFERHTGGQFCGRSDT